MRVTYYLVYPRTEPRNPEINQERFARFVSNNSKINGELLAVTDDKKMLKSYLVQRKCKDFVNIKTEVIIVDGWLDPSAYMKYESKQIDQYWLRSDPCIGLGYKPMIDFMDKENFYKFREELYMDDMMDYTPYYTTREEMDYLTANSSELIYEMYDKKLHKYLNDMPLLPSIFKKDFRKLLLLLGYEHTIMYLHPNKKMCEYILQNSKNPFLFQKQPILSPEQLFEETFLKGVI